MKKVPQYTPPEYREQEETKQKAYPILYGKYGFEEKMQAALSLIRAHFDRSYERAIEGRYWQSHPNFEEYIAMMDYTGVIPSNVWQEICKRYGRNIGHIPPGYTLWFTPGSKARKGQFSSWQSYEARKRLESSRKK